MPPLEQPPVVREPRLSMLAVAALLIAALAASLHLALIDGDASSWVRAGENLVDDKQLPDGFVQESGLGYDGRFFYRLARSPLSTAEFVDGIAFDRPAFRHQRIGYPVAAWAASLGGQQDLVPAALIVVNLLGIAAAAAGLGLIARGCGLTPWTGLLAIVLPAGVVALHFDLSEITESALLVWAMVLLRQRAWAPAAALMALAVLTRETALLLPLGLVASVALRKVGVARRLGLAADRSTPIWPGLMPVAVYVAWASAISLIHSSGATSTAQTASHFRPSPLAIPELARELLDKASFDVAAIVLFLAAGLVGIYALRHRDAGRPHERLALIGSSVIALTFNGWDRAIVYLRHPGVWVLFAVVVVLASPARHRHRQITTIAVVLTILAVVTTVEILTTEFPTV